MSRRFVLSPLAKADLDEIFDYSFEKWGLTRTEAYIATLRQATIALAEGPEAGLTCDGIRPGYFRSLAGSHVIFYKIYADHIDIVRFLHQSMDFDRHL